MSRAAVGVTANTVLWLSTLAVMTLVLPLTQMAKSLPPSVAALTAAAILLVAKRKDFAGGIG
jgi:hypothetical protein